MSDLLRNERVKYVPDYMMYVTECFCPYCRMWKVDWGGGSIYRERRICPSCTWAIRQRATDWREKD